MEALRQELAEAKAQVTAAKASLLAAEAATDTKVDDSAVGRRTVDDDRISHSSFAVGDVGLFMPTGRGSGGGVRGVCVGGYAGGVGGGG